MSENKKQTSYKQQNDNDFIDASNSLLYDKLAVVIKTKSGKIFQVALTQEMIDVLYLELKTFFKGGKVKILPTEITAIDLD